MSLFKNCSLAYVVMYFWPFLDVHEYISSFLPSTTSELVTGLEFYCSWKLSGSRLTCILKRSWSEWKPVKKEIVSWLQHTSGCFHCMLYHFALGSNVSTLMTVQWCKWGRMVEHVICNVCGCLSTDEAPIWQTVTHYPSSLCKMIVICFRLVAISFYYKFPEHNTPFLPFEVMFACCIIFIRCTTYLFKLAHDALKLWNLLSRFGSTSSASHFYISTLLPPVFSCTSESHILLVQAFIPEKCSSL
jgi:hypothetical protein